MFDGSKKFDPEKIGITKNAQRNPDTPACILQDRTISFGQLDREINTLASALQRLGLLPAITCLLFIITNMEFLWCGPLPRR